MNSLKRWNSHRSSWDTVNLSNNQEQVPLLHHVVHELKIEKKPKISECFIVMLACAVYCCRHDKTEERESVGTQSQPRAVVVCLQRFLPEARYDVLNRISPEL